jgi:hypothetical protein
MVGFGSVVNDKLGMVKEWLECEWDDGVNVGLLKELGTSARLLTKVGGVGMEKGGMEKDPVGLVNEPVKEWWEKEPVNVGIVKEPVNDGLVKELGTSARLLREDGGGGLEKEPVGLVNEPVKEKVGLLCEEWEWWEKETVPDGLLKELGLSSARFANEDGCGIEKLPVGTEKLPVGLVKDGNVPVNDGQPVKLPVGFGKVPVKEGIVNEASSRLLKDPVPEG